MKNIKTILWSVFFLLVVACDKQSSSATAAETTVATAEYSVAPTAKADFKEGTDYTLLATVMPTRDPKKIEVIEFFWYGCPHCYALEPRLEAWVAKLPSTVDFWRSPVIWGPVREAHAQVYYTAESLGVLDKTHKAFFDAVHDAKSENAYTKEDEIKAFFKTVGVAEDKFEQNFKSFTVMSKIKQADARGRGYAIQGVPTLVVNGRYAVQGSMPKALEVVDYLIQKEKK
jgi:thiol:disulfide interchange protein DsbA